VKKYLFSQTQAEGGHMYAGLHKSKFLFFVFLIGQVWVCVCVQAT